MISLTGKRRHKLPSLLGIQHDRAVLLCEVFLFSGIFSLRNLCTPQTTWARPQPATDSYINYAYAECFLNTKTTSTLLRNLLCIYSFHSFSQTLTHLQSPPGSIQTPYWVSEHCQENLHYKMRESHSLKISAAVHD